MAAASQSHLLLRSAKTNPALLRKRWGTLSIVRGKKRSRKAVPPVARSTTKSEVQKAGDKKPEQFCSGSYSEENSPAEIERAREVIAEAERDHQQQPEESGADCHLGQRAAVAHVHKEEDHQHGF